MTRSRLAPRWALVVRGAGVGGGGVALVGLVAAGGYGIVDAVAGAAVVGANIGLGIVMLALRLVVTPLVCWWLLRRLGVPRAGQATVVGLVVYLPLALANPTDPELPGDVVSWVLQGGVAGTVACYLVGTLDAPEPVPPPGADEGRG